MSVQIAIPAFFLCPISLELMTDPVTLSSGLTYDRPNIQKWLDDHPNPSCPVTRMPIDPDLEELIPNHALRRLIQTWCMQNAGAGIERVPTPRQPPSLKDIPHLLEQVRLHHAAAAGDGLRRRSADALHKLCVLASDRAKARLLLLRTGAPHVLSLFLSRELALCRNASIPSAEVEDALYLLAALTEETQAGGLDAAFTWEPACKEDLLGLAKIIAEPRTKMELRRDAAILLRSAASFKFTRSNAGAMEGFMDAVIGLIREATKHSMVSLRHGSSKSSLEYFSIAGLGLLHSVCKQSTHNRYLAIEVGGIDALATLLRNVHPDANACPPSGHVRIIEVCLKVWECLCKCADGRAATHQLLGLLIGSMCTISQNTTKYSIQILWLLLKFAPMGSTIARQVVELGGFLKAIAVAQDSTSLKLRSLAIKITNVLSHYISCSHLNLK